MNKSNMRKSFLLQRPALIIYVTILILLSGAALSLFMHRDKIPLFGAVPNSDSQTQTPTVPIVPNESSKPIADAATLNIPELGIEITLPKGLEGLEYEVQENTQDSRVLYATFATPDLIKKNGGDTRCSIGTITRWTSDPGKLASSSRAIAVGKYYYSHTKPQQPCINADATYTTQQQQANLLREAFDTISEL